MLLVRSPVSMKLIEERRSEMEQNGNCGVQAAERKKTGVHVEIEEIGQ